MNLFFNSFALEWISIFYLTVRSIILSLDVNDNLSNILSLLSRSVVSHSLQPHALQHARPPCLSPTPGACSGSRPSSQWCHPTISSSVIPLSSRLQSFPASCVVVVVFSSSESALHMRWPKYWSFCFNISPSNEHPGLSSFRMDWLDLPAVQGTLKNLLQPTVQKH